MNDAEIAPDTIELDADRAVARGDVAAAKVLLQRVTALAPERIDTWLKLAALRRASGDTAGALAAISGALQVDPLHFLALLSRARVLEGAGQPEEGARAYARALAQLPDGEAPPAGLLPLITHARKVSDAFTERTAAEWDRAIAADPALSTEARARLARFKTNALRQTRVYHSEPTHYHYPGLAEREFHDRAAFPWLAEFENATDAIRDELLALLQHHSAHAEPYVQYAADAPVRQWSALNNSLDWTAFHLLQGGRPVPANADLCPATMAVLAGIDQPRIADRSPNAMFSLLRPRTKIPPHTGIANTRLVCHLPLIVPPGCWFRVGATRREWKVGEAFVFDDTIEHEAANESDAPRVVLIIDLWHPDLDPAERAGVKRAMEADAASPESGL